MRTLLVEDQASLAHQLERRLKRAGYCVDHVETLREAREALVDNPYSVALLDRRLPDGDGLSLISTIRRQLPDCRVLMLTALEAVDDRIAGLDAGADDYLVKPFDLEEMMARIRAASRRSGEPTPPVTLGALMFDGAGRTVSVAGKAALFHNRELALLESLLRRAGVIVRRETLMSEIWGLDDEIQPHALTLLVARVRSRLQQLGAGVEVHSARGVGYMIAEIES